MGKPKVQYLSKTDKKKKKPKLADPPTESAQEDETASFVVYNPPVIWLHLFCFDRYYDPQIEDKIRELKEHDIETIFYKSPDDRIVTKKLPCPRVYLSIGDWEQYEQISLLPLCERRRWLSVDSIDDIEWYIVYNCWLLATDPLPENKHVPPNRFSSEEPLVSLFTSAYRSGKKIERPYQSLLRQTYTNWEWIVIDDSGDDEETYRNCILPLDDRRIRKFRQESRSGYIGNTKRLAAGLCSGEILVELDHDDDLISDCLEQIVYAFKKHPECGFAFGESAELFEHTKLSGWYDWDVGFGFGAYWAQQVDFLNTGVFVNRTADLNWLTIQHLVGLPNHPRAWTRDCYYAVGCHRNELSVADDYDLLVRTFLCTRFVRIPHLLYIQYANEGNNNYTEHRREQIQVLVERIHNQYHSRIEARLAELEMPRLSEEEEDFKRIWNCETNHDRWKHATVTMRSEGVTSFLFPMKEDHDHALLEQLEKVFARAQKQQWTRSEIIVIGEISERITRMSFPSPDGYFRWWEMEQDEDVLSCLRYAAYVSSGEKIKFFLPSAYEKYRLNYVDELSRLNYNVEK
jgi:glycosyltransferase involved in cell wall biosynthesis